MDWKRFLLANFAGAALWVTVIACAGYFFGSQYEALAGVVKETELVVLVVVVAAILYLWRRNVIRTRERKQREREMAEKR